MSAQHPTPWRAEGRDNGKRGRLRREFWAILDRNEFFVAEGLDETTALEIVDAVNERAKFEELRMKFPDFRPVIIAAGQRDAAIAERDRLRDIVRRLSDLSESLLANYEYRYREDANSMAFVGNTRDFIREARAAIGEDAR